MCYHVFLINKIKTYLCDFVCSKRWLSFWPKNHHKKIFLKIHGNMLMYPSKAKKIGRNWKVSLYTDLFHVSTLKKIEAQSISLGKSILKVCVFKSIGNLVLFSICLFFMDNSHFLGSGYSFLGRKFVRPSILWFVRENVDNFKKESFYEIYT